MKGQALDVGLGYRIKQDDRTIQNEGLDTLSEPELQAAFREWGNAGLKVCGGNATGNSPASASSDSIFLSLGFVFLSSRLWTLLHITLLSGWPCF
jgi:hypothetical protein